MQKIQRLVFKGYILNIKHKSNNILLDLCVKQEKQFSNRVRKTEFKTYSLKTSPLSLTKTFVLF